MAASTRSTSSTGRWPRTSGPAERGRKAHTYANHVKATLLPLVFALRHAPEGVDLMRDAQFRVMCRFFANLLSPPDSILGGRRGRPGRRRSRVRPTPTTATAFGWLVTACDGPSRSRSRALPLGHGNRPAAAPASRRKRGRLFSPLLLPGTIEFRAGTAAARSYNTAGIGCRLPRHQLERVGRDAAGRSLRPKLGGITTRIRAASGGGAGGRPRVRRTPISAAGALKFAHRGHNVLGYPGRDPLQILDRVDYHVDRCETRSRRRRRGPLPDSRRRVGGPTRITRSGSTHGRGRTSSGPLSYDGRDTLHIVDEPAHSPDATVVWSLHIPCVTAHRATINSISFNFSDGARCELQNARGPR